MCLCLCPKLYRHYSQDNSPSQSQLNVAVRGLLLIIYLVKLNSRSLYNVRELVSKMSHHVSCVEWDVKYY